VAVNSGASGGFYFSAAPEFTNWPGWNIFSLKGAVYMSEIEKPKNSNIGSSSSILSIGSVGSILSIGSSGSILSIGSSGSILSIGSIGSVLSIVSAGSVGSIFSALSVGSMLSLGSVGSMRSAFKLGNKPLFNRKQKAADPSQNGKFIELVKD
jgi:hypothetical protein